MSTAWESLLCSSAVAYKRCDRVEDCRPSFPSLEKKEKKKKKVSGPRSCLPLGVVYVYGFWDFHFFFPFFFPVFHWWVFEWVGPTKVFVRHHCGSQSLRRTQKRQKKEKGKKKIPACGRKFLHRFNLPLKKRLGQTNLFLCVRALPAGKK